MKRALVDPNDRITDIVDPGAEFPVAPGFVWRDAPADVTHRHVWDGVGFVVAPPIARTTLTYVEFRDRFAAAELTAMRAAVIIDGEALDWALEAAADNSIRLASATTAAFMQKMVDAGIVTPARRDEILTP